MLRKWRSSLFLLSSSLFLCTVAQQSFANTKFDLSPNLPFEDLISESKDEKPKQVLAKPVKKQSPKLPAPVPVAPPSTTLPPPPPPPPTPPPTLPTLPPVSPVTLPSPLPHAPISFPTMPSIAPFTFATFAPPPVPAVTPPPAVHNAPIADPAPPPSNYIPLHGHREIQLVPANQHRDRAELWFRDVFDFSACVKNVDSVSERFLQKFPRNLLKNNKEVVLAELLNSRLKECIRKQERNEWVIIDQNIATLNLPASEETECRSGIVQEEISCYNVQSYSCQFVQPRYNFRLVPTRIIVQEARLAEDGAEKCRKITKLLKKQKILSF